MTTHQIHDALQFEHKQITEVWKTIIDAFFKLAALSFTFNGVLLTAISFMGNKSAGLTELGLKYGWVLIGSTGVVYNLGALSFFIANTILQWNINNRTRAIEGDLGLKIQETRSWGFLIPFSLYALLTLVFFLAFVGIWFALAWTGYYFPSKIHDFFELDHHQPNGI